MDNKALTAIVKIPPDEDKKLGLLINVSREVRAGLLNSKGCDVNSMVAIVIL